MLPVVRLDKKILKRQQKYHLKYFAYGFGDIEPMIFKTQSEFLRKISKWNFTINPLIKNYKWLR